MAFLVVIFFLFILILFFLPGKVVPKPRLVICPKCRQFLPEPPGFDVYKCGGCGTLLKAKKRSVAVNSESSIQEIDADPRNALDLVSEGKQRGPPLEDSLKEKATTSSGEFYLDGNVGKGQNENGEYNGGKVVPFKFSDEELESELDIYKLSLRRHRVSNKGGSNKNTHGEIEEIDNGNLSLETPKEVVPKLRIVRCPKCRQLLKEPPGFDVYYKCGGCGTVLKGKQTVTRIHDVFLSFRGEDTRASFTSHLHATLQNDGINVFIDDHSLERGDRISASLLQAIKDSQISVVVFSTNYADSRWCLEELEKIMECHRTIGQVVLPVFYDVDPSEVRHQTGEFGKAFQNLLDRICREVILEHLELRWRKALREAAGLAGFVIVNCR